LQEYNKGHGRSGGKKMVGTLAFGEDRKWSGTLAFEEEKTSRHRHWKEKE
jgi:hypothetical protein